MKVALAVWLACAAVGVGAGEAEKPKGPEKQEAPARRTFLWPLWGTRTTEDGSSLALFPFACAGQKGDESHLIILPVYARREKEGSKAQLFFPLFGRFTGKEALPTYADVPLLLKWTNTDGERTVKLPVVLRVGKGDPKSDAPYTIVDIANLGGPAKLLEVRKGKEGWSVEALSVLGGRPVAEAPKPGGLATALTAIGIPIVGCQRGEKASLSHILPVLWIGRNEEKDERLFRIWPLIGRHRQGKLHQWSLASPLIAFSHEEGAPRYAAVLPAFAWFNQQPEGRRGVYAFPVVSLRKGKEGEEATDFAVLPLFWLHRDPQHKTQVTQVLPVLWARNDELEARTYGLLPLAWYSHAPKRWRLDLLPVLSMMRAPERSHFSLRPLFGWGRQGEKRRVWMALGLISFGI